MLTQKSQAKGELCFLGVRFHGRRFIGRGQGKCNRQVCYLFPCFFPVSQRVYSRARERSDGIIAERSRAECQKESEEA